MYNGASVRLFYNILKFILTRDWLGAFYAAFEGSVG
jgi:hypothetical protein